MNKIFLYKCSKAQKALKKESCENIKKSSILIKKAKQAPKSPILIDSNNSLKTTKRLRVNGVTNPIFWLYNEQPSWADDLPEEFNARAVKADDLSSSKLSKLRKDILML